MPSAKKDDFEGYVSLQGKHRHSIIMCLSAAVFFLVINAASQAYVTISMQSSMLQMIGQGTMFGERAVFWHDKMWVPTLEPQQQFVPVGNLQWATFDSTGTPSENGPTKIDTQLPTPIVLEDRVWWIADDGIYRQMDGQPQLVNSSQTLGAISTPFFYKGKVTILEETTDANFLGIRHLEGESWADGGKVAESITHRLETSAITFRMGMKIPSAMNMAFQELRFLEIDGRLAAIRNLNGGIATLENVDDLLDADGQPLPRPKTFQKWKTLVTTAENWAVGVIDSVPTLVYYSGKSKEIITLQYDGNEWTELFRIKQGGCKSINLHELPDSDSWVLLTQHNAALTEVFKVTGKEFQSIARAVPIASSDILSHVQTMMGLSSFGMLLFLVLAIFFNAKYRIPGCRNDESQFNAAMLPRRSIAKLIDLAISRGPATYISFAAMSQLEIADLVVGFGLFFGYIDELPDELVEWLVKLGWATLWSVFYFTFCCVSEGLTGRTIGKAICRIKVTKVNLEPCGFFRALGRNLLFMIDTMVNLAVGILAMSLTKKWQRVGDLLCGTMVICPGTIQPLESAQQARSMPLSEAEMQADDALFKEDWPS
ncbi:MAG: hypothetical protein CMJ78_07570 [Planctomycetaceae bacterium]|nr:hypothetical protein [Planctomycetaceae bacterium]